MDGSEAAHVSHVYLAYGKTMHAAQRLERAHLNIAAMTQAAKDVDPGDKDAGNAPPVGARFR
jgi:hypothetical protein